MTPKEEEIVANALETISEKVRKFKFTLFPYFKDFDRVFFYEDLNFFSFSAKINHSTKQNKNVKSTAYTKNVTKLQFGRVLLTLNLMPSNSEYELICKKFEDPVTGDVNYPIFCQSVEEGKF